jgi:DNA-binding MarR family transcriptional regulator
MTTSAKLSERVVAELIAQLGRIAYGEGLVGGLTPAQWTVLRYFARANRFSRTVSAFAEFHATTRGTASQTVKCLVNRDYLVRKRSQRDARSARIDLTDKGTATLADDPFEALVRAARNLSPTTRLSLGGTLQRMLGHVVQERGRCHFGMCPGCEHLRGDGSSIEGKPPYECGLVGEPLEEAEIGQLCVNFEPGRSSGAKRAVGATPRP